MSMITLQEVPDLQTEKFFVESGKCTFGVSERATRLFITTKEEGLEKLQQLSGWKMILNAGTGNLKRFEVKGGSKDQLAEQLESIYGPGKVRWLPK